MHGSPTANIQTAVAALARGGLVAFPTETVYGLGADATSDAAVAKVYSAKGRPVFNPLISHVATIDQAFALGQFSNMAQKLAKAFWPGPLTIVVPRAENCPVSLLASAGQSSIAIRVPQHPVALELLRAFAKPVVAPSANRSGRISPTTAEHVQQSLGSDVDLILDGGECAVGLESTVVSFLDNAPRLLRPGGLERHVIETVLGKALAAAPANEIHSPGQLESHYAPRAQLRLNVAEPQNNETYIGFGTYNHGPYSLSRRGDMIEAAAALFAMLHQMDASGIECIAVAPIPNHGLGEAINDRLRRAAAPRLPT